MTAPFLTAVYCVLVPFLYWAFARVRPDRYNVIAAVLCVAGVGLVSLTRRRRRVGPDLPHVLEQQRHGSRHHRQVDQRQHHLRPGQGLGGEGRPGAARPRTPRVLFV